MFVDAGCENTRTYIQSGNVVFEANQALARRIPRLITEAISKRFRIQISVVVRSASELQSVVRNNAFLRAGAQPNKLHVVFLAKQLRRATVGALESDRSPPDEFVVRGSEIYLHCPNGVARTKLTNAYFDSKLGTTSTVRNWNTVLKLSKMAE